MIYPSIGIHLFSRNSSPLNKHETSFYMFKHSLASPDCILSKTDKSKKNNITYNLKLQNRKKTRFTQIDDLLSILKRR